PYRAASLRFSTAPSCFDGLRRARAPEPHAENTIVEVGLRRRQIGENARKHEVAPPRANLHDQLVASAGDIDLPLFDERQLEQEHESAILPLDAKRSAAIEEARRIVVPEDRRTQRT